MATRADGGWPRGTTATLPDGSLVLLVAATRSGSELWRVGAEGGPQRLLGLPPHRWMRLRGWEALFGGDRSSLELWDLRGVATRRHVVTVGPAGARDASAVGGAAPVRGGWWTLEGGGHWLVRRDADLRRVEGRALPGSAAWAVVGTERGAWVLQGPGTNARWFSARGAPRGPGTRLAAVAAGSARAVERDRLLVALHGAWLLLEVTGSARSQGGFDGLVDVVTPVAHAPPGEPDGAALPSQPRPELAVPGRFSK